MKMNQIVIQIDDPYRYAEVALLVDQPWLEPFILQTRQEFAIDSLFPYQEYNNFYSSLTPLNKSQAEMTNQVVKIFQKNLADSYLHAGNTTITVDDKNFTGSLMNIYSKQIIFETKILTCIGEHIENDYPVDEILKKAIVTGEVRDEDLKHKPNTRISADNIRRDRKMYWMKVRSGKSYTDQDISDELKKLGELIEPSSVSKQINTYARRLESFHLLKSRKV